MPLESGSKQTSHDLHGDFDVQDSSSIDRLRSDFRLAIVVLFGICAIAVIAPFGVYRLVSGELWIALADGVLVTVLAMLTIYVWRSGRVAVAGNLMAVAMSLVFFLVYSLIGISAMWISPVLVANFLLADRRLALGSSGLMILVLALQPENFSTAVDYWSGMATAILVSFFSLIFASRTDVQQRMLAEYAERDSLTRALNRRVLRNDLDRLFAQRSRVQQPVAMALLDLDHFKSINDRFGHDAGDCVLIEFARIVRSHVRASDRFYRLGGEEFLLLMPGTDHKGLQAALAKLHRLLRRQLSHDDHSVTVSIGAAVFTPGETIRSWMARADAALYRAKREGRDRVELAGPPAAEESSAAT